MISAVALVVLVACCMARAVMENRRPKKVSGNKSGKAWEQDYVWPEVFEDDDEGDI